MRRARLPALPRRHIQTNVNNLFNFINGQLFYISENFLISVMECRNFLEVRICNSNDRTRVTRFIKKSGKLSRAVYAGLIVCFVPSVLSGWPRSKQQLTFDEIYNGTNYAQLQQRPRPYDITEFSYDIEHSHTPNLRGEHRIVSHNYHLEDSRQPDTRIYRLPDHTYPVTPAYHIEEHTLPNKIYKLEDKRVNHPIRKLKDSIQLSKPKGLYIDEIRHIPESYSYSESDSDNELENVPATELAKVPLLVGVSHDPFRYSIPNEDYLRGVRDISQMPLGKGERGKRGVFHLYNMMYCATGCEPLSYKGYGCYCGFLGSGRPVDGIDNCCKMHDECYENIYCPFFTVYFQPYYWKCFRGQPLCALENYETQHQFINGCAARLCECDRKFAMCVRRYRCPTRRALCRSSPLRLLQNLIMF